MIVDIGTYQFPERVGYTGWVNFEKYIAFEALDGQVIVIDRR